MDSSNVDLVAHSQSGNSGPYGDPPESPWYLAYTKPRQEHYACERLQEQGYRTFLPTMTRWTRKRDEWRTTSFVMFPRYLMVRPGDPQQAISPISSTPGVSTLVRFGSTLATLSGARFKALQLLTEQVAKSQPEQPFEAGSHVVFSSGPLKGAAGIVSDVARERVTVMLTLLGQPQKFTESRSNLAVC